MVSGKDKQRIVEPGLSGRLFKKESQGIVRVAYSPIDRQISFNRILLLISLRDIVGMMRRSREGRCQERFLKGSHHIAHILQELLVPDGPETVKHRIAAVLGLLYEILHSKVVVVSYHP